VVGRALSNGILQGRKREFLYTRDYTGICQRDAEFQSQKRWKIEDGRTFWLLSIRYPKSREGASTVNVFANASKIAPDCR